MLTSTFVHLCGCYVLSVVVVHELTKMVALTFCLVSAAKGM